MTTRKQRIKHERLHSHYQKIAYRRLIKELRAMLGGIPLDYISYETALATVALNVNEDTVRDMLNKVYLDIGLKYGRKSIAEINKIIEKKSDVPYPLFSEKYQRFIFNYLIDPKKGGVKVVSISDTLTKSVMKIVAESQAEGLTNAQMAKKVQETVNKPNFYRWKAMRITKTETSFAMNTARETSFEESTIKMTKTWGHGGSANPRHDHAQMDGVTIGADELFTLPNGETCKYPHDPVLTASQVVNCACFYGYEALRDSDGNIVYK